MLDAVIFDYDGVLAPTDKRQFNWFNHWWGQNKSNESFPFKDQRAFMPQYNSWTAQTGGVQNVYDELGLPCDMTDKDHPVWAAYIEFSSTHPNQLYGGMVDAIKEIWELGSLTQDPHQNNRMRLGINSTNTWKSISMDLVKANVLPYFDFKVTREDLDAYHGAGGGDHLKKPSKVSLALALNGLNANGTKTVHIGDTLNDLRASHDIVRFGPRRTESLITIGACYGYEGKNVLEQGIQTSSGRVHFDYLVDKPQELIGIIKDLHLKK